MIQRQLAHALWLLENWLLETFKQKKTVAELRGARGKLFNFQIFQDR